MSGNTEKSSDINWYMIELEHIKRNVVQYIHMLTFFGVFRKFKQCYKAMLVQQNIKYLLTMTYLFYVTSALNIFHNDLE